MPITDASVQDRLAALEAAKDKELLLTHYAEREPKEFLQYDHFGVPHPPVDDGPGNLTAGYTIELMRGAACRVLVDPKTESEDAVTMLREIADWIERDGLVTFDPNDVPF
jgi:hypothetical protein